jgi:hypothetical protein
MSPYFDLRKDAALFACEGAVEVGEEAGIQGGNAGEIRSFGRGRRGVRICCPEARERECLRCGRRSREEVDPIEEGWTR